MFNDHGPVMTPELELLYAYGSLTILHDHVLKSRYDAIAGPDIWPPDDQFAKLVRMRWREMSDNWSAWQTVIDMALDDVRADLTQAGPPDAAKATEDDKRRKGSPPKYSDDLCKRAQAEYDELRAKQKDSKGAWSTVAEHPGFPNGDAARAACYRYRAKRESAN